MGWTSFHKPYGMSVDEFFDKEFNSKNFILVGRGALVNLSEYYRAVFIPVHENYKGETVGGYYICLVCLVHFEGNNLAYKDMTEDMLPYYFNCPKRILDIVEQSKPYNENARIWRERCHKVLARRKELDYGKVIKFKEPFSFKGGYEEDTFTIIDGNPYGERKSMGLKSYHHGFKARIPKWKSMDFEIL